MKVMILCVGLGTRLREETESRPLRTSRFRIPRPAVPLSATAPARNRASNPRFFWKTACAGVQATIAGFTL